MRGDGNHSFRTVENRHVLIAEPVLELACEFGAEAANLLGHQSDVASSRHRDYLKAVGEAFNHVERGDADRTGRTEDCDGFHGATSITAMRARPSAGGSVRGPSEGSNGRTCGS